MAQSLNISTLTSTLGAYFRENKGLLAENLYHTMANSPLVSSATILTCTDEVPIPSILIKDIVRPATAPDSFSATSNAIEFGARLLKVRRFKFDLSLQPQELELSYMSYMKTPGSEHESKFTLEQYIMDQIVKKAQQDIRKGLTVGVYNASGTTPASIVNGFVKLIADEVTASNIVETTPTTTHVHTQLEEIYNDLGEVYKEMETVAILPAAIYDAWITADVQSLGRTWNYNSMEQKIVGSNCVVKRDAMLTGTKCYIFPKNNYLYIGADTMAEHTQVRVQEIKRDLVMLGDGKIGVQIAFTNPTVSPIACGDITL
jgi:hypothetical protein